MDTPLIEFKEVTKRFGRKTVLDKVSFRVFEGETTTIIGKSGVGKSVTLKQIIGLLDPDGGEIRLGGRSLRDMKRRERRRMKSQFSYMFQNNALFDSMTVYENVALPLREKTSLPGVEIRQRVLSKIEQLELSDVVDQYPSQISGGMQKRVALARALITEPKIVLFDEPTTGLDPIRKNAVLGMIAHYRKRFGFTAVVVSHDIPDVFFISDRIIFLYDGAVVFQGSAPELEQFDHPVIEEFIDSVRSLKDELTGLESRRSFERQYEHEFGPIKAMEAFTVALFSIRGLDAVEEQAGPRAAQHVIRLVAFLIDKHVGFMGISARYSRAEVLCVLPHTDRERAEWVLQELAADLPAQLLTESHLNEATVGRISIWTGLAEGKPGSELNEVVAEARAGQVVLWKAEVDAKTSSESPGRDHGVTQGVSLRGTR
jgi:phospholipid/cholesterol/gamma-HCH transport system ATP-binding protein